MTMLDGYNSTVTVADGLRLVHVFWIAAGGVMLAVGATNVSSGAREPSTMVDALRSGAGLALVLTVVAWMFWAIQFWANIPRVGRKARLGIWDLSKPFLVTGTLAGIAGLVALGSESLRGRVGSAALLLFGLTLMILPRVALETMNLFWRSGTGVGEPSSGPPLPAKAWVGATWVLVLGVVVGGVADLDGRQAALGVIGLGLAAIAAGVCGVIVFPQMSERIDDRVSAIVSEVEGDAAPDDGVGVSDHQIESAWADSEGLVNFST